MSKSKREERTNVQINLEKSEHLAFRATKKGITENKDM